MHGGEDLLAGRRRVEAERRDVQREDLEVVVVRRVLDGRLGTEITGGAGAVRALLHALRVGKQRLGRQAFAKAGDVCGNVIDQPVNERLRLLGIRVVGDDDKGLRALRCAAPIELGRGVVAVGYRTPRAWANRCRMAP